MGVDTTQPNPNNESILCPARSSRGSVDVKHPFLENRATVILFHNNARRQTLDMFRKKIVELGWQQVLQTRSFPGLVISVFHLFRFLENYFRVKAFLKKTLKTGLTHLFSSKPFEFYNKWKYLKLDPYSHPIKNSKFLNMFPNSNSAVHMSTLYMMMTSHRVQ